ncbi:unnamed protein product [Rotaria sordida]|uniref:NHL repeat containing protein n=2 Tax=Rotaria sordida TaxID=392033 RepID=A0A814FP57_9BILA|nr:unnamed protein product [Rotaria sordida]CAF0983158.1 unnamed protein product [Rotaria sordida]CAF1080963.1 unnamed protein product [Rotaria sordida]CAF1102815.1 unnamed protein product [Rotaria sordida]CAF1110924.1 unnamed protein product [Rotaria sordida]
MPTDAFMKSNILQWSDWSTSEPVVSQQQQKPLDKSSKTGNVTLRWNTTGITIAGIMNQHGTDSNLLDWPISLAIDSSNALYIGDHLNHRVQKFLSGISNGTTVAGQSSGAQNRTPTSLNFPVGVIVDSSGNLYVADSGNSRVQLWASGASSGSTVAGNGTAGTSANQLNVTYGIARDPSSNTLYVADYGNHRIMAYTSNASSGSLVAGGNGIGLNKTQLYNPSTIYFDSPSNSLIIANRYGHNIVRWTLGDSQWTLIAGSTNGTQGSSSTLLNSPFGMTLDPMGNVYVADTSNHRIQLFMAGQLTGLTIAGSAGARGNDSNQFWAPYAVALDSQLNLYVADRNNNRVQKFLRY